MEINLTNLDHPSKNPAPSPQQTWCKLLHRKRTKEILQRRVISTPSYVAILISFTYVRLAIYDRPFSFNTRQHARYSSRYNTATFSTSNNLISAIALKIPLPCPNGRLKFSSYISVDQQLETEVQVKIK